MKYKVVEKRVGTTPLQELEVLRKSDSLLRDEPLTYAGRLDPMASGKLLVLIGDECKKKPQYLGLDKEYEFEILLGVKTDTGDILGLSLLSEMDIEFSQSKLSAVLQSAVGSHSFPYPSFSSKTVNGKPLFEHALEGTLESIEKPTRESRVYSINSLGSRMCTGRDVIRDISSRLASLQVETNTGTSSPDFRRDEVLESWRIAVKEDKEYMILKVRATVSSGTYIRTLAPHIAENLGTYGLAYSIHRTKIGKYYHLFGSLGFWLRTF